jgi:hypothetical protein
MGASKNHHNAMMTAAYRIIVESDVFQNLTPVLQERIKGYLEPPEEYLPSWREFSFQWHDLNLEVKLTLGITTQWLTVEPDGLPMTLTLTHSFECVSYRQTLQQFSESIPVIQKMTTLGLAFNKIEPIRALAMTRDEITAEEKRAEIVKSHTAVQNIIIFSIFLYQSSCLRSNRNRTRYQQANQRTKGRFNPHRRSASKSH